MDSNIEVDSKVSHGDPEFEKKNSNKNLREGMGMLESVISPGSGFHL